MLSRADDYPIHQRPEPIAVAGSDRNFYDRYFFNGQSPDGRHFFAAALGVYPHLNLIDAAFAVMADGVQRSVFASRILHHERMDTRVGPLAVAVLEPLQRLGLTLADTEGLAADLVFTGRHAPIEEPRFTRRQGSRLLMDVTRMTVNGDWSGTLTLDGTPIDVGGWQGTRDRSWGIRPIGSADAQPVVPPVPPQFFWAWAPLNFPHHSLYFHSNDDETGAPWNRSALLVDLASGAETKLAQPAFTFTYRPGTRRVAAATLTGLSPQGPVTVSLTPQADFHMHGIGYGHPKHGHGAWRGDHHLATERFGPGDPAIPLNAHIQALVAAELRLPDGTTHAGRGVLEQLFIGPHAPSGFRELFDLAPA
ncbi:hypothetical protein [Sandaracinobacteroides saxicola]|uniref:Carotenoid 1,2-hydratase n=1 Tax=Sandaracinobacteroides saxicola TaxID=2759707 RepID=A0A7G5IKG0_9SPHN|nr:hypothetical protein [Sandaracinobacteroides saxicola]QMW23852.1 hypothetical protein H3309_05085 [Sandaracinobacteroides saxicola]